MALKLKSGFHSHLQANGPAQCIELPEELLRPSQTEETDTVTDETAAAKYDHRKHHYHDNAGKQSTDTCAKQSQFGEAQFSVDEDIIAYDVQRIPSEQNPHRRLGVGDAIRELLESVEQHDKDQRGKQHQIVGFYQRHQFIGLSQPLDVEIDNRHDKSQQQCHQHIGQ